MSVMRVLFGSGILDSLRHVGRTVLPSALFSGTAPAARQTARPSAPPERRLKPAGQVGNLPHVRRHSTYFVVLAFAASLTVDSGRADWVKDNFITDDTEILSAQANEKLINTTVELAKQSKRFDSLK